MDFKSELLTSGLHPSGTRPGPEFIALKKL